MSAIKLGISNDLHSATKDIDHPWNYIVQNISSLTPEQIVEHACNASHLKVSGVFYKNKQYTFELLALQINERNAHVLRALYGLSVTMATGVVHPYLTQHVRSDWAIRFFDIKIHNSPAFVYACKQRYQSVIVWMIDIMNDLKNYTPIYQLDCDDNSPLHIAIMYRKWEWAERLIEHGCSPYAKNAAGKTPLMLAAPYYEHLHILKTNTLDWFEALHDALVDGKKHAAWCQTLIDAGADFNQPGLYNSPLDTLIVLAHAGIDMNMSFDDKLTAEQYRIMYVYGKLDDNLKAILSAFEEDDWVRMLYKLYNKQEVPIVDEFAKNVASRRAITKITKRLQQTLIKI